MKRLCQLVVVIMALLFCALSANQPLLRVATHPHLGINITDNRVFAATNCALTSGASQSTVQAALTAAGSSSCTGTANATTVSFGAGSYSITSGLTWPCGASVTGPAVTIQPGPFGVVPTATVNSSGYQGFAFNYPAGCNTTGVVFQYLELNGTNSIGNGGIAIGNLGGAGGAGPTIQFNYIHGMQPSVNNYEFESDEGIFIATAVAGSGLPTWTNLTIQNNRFGTGTFNGGAPGQGDCTAGNVMQTFFYPYTQAGNNTYNYNNIGGYCSAIQLYANTSNLIIANNNVFHLEEGFKFLEPGSNSGQQGCTGSYLSGAPNQLCHSNSTINYNDFSNIHRIAIEAQDTPNPTMNFNYNDWHDCLNCGFGSWIFSLPQDNNAQNCVGSCNFYTNSDFGLLVGNQPQVTLYGQAGGSVPGNEFWGFGHENYNLFQSNNISCGVHWGWGQAPWAFNNNQSQGSMQVACTEEGGTSPANSGNTSTGTIAAVTSVAPTISPAGGSFTGSQVVTLSNPGTNRDANTGIWYTTDGTTPVPGSGTAQYIATGGTLTLTSTTTVKAVGMWGARNQPTSYPSGYGYVPSAVISATFTGNSTQTATPTFTPASETFYTTVSVSLASSSPSPTIYYTLDGSTPTTSSAVYSSPIPLSATTTVKAIATSLGLSQSAVGSSTYTYQKVAVSSCTQGNNGSVNTLFVNGTEQQWGYCTYPGPVTYQCFPSPDMYGNTIIAWASLAPSVITVNSGGLVTGAGAGSGNTTATATGGVPCSQWTWTVSAVSLTSVSLGATGNVSSIAYQATNQLLASCHYSDGSTTSCNTADSHGNAVTSWASGTPAATVSTSGLLTAAALGSTSITAIAGGLTSSPALVLSVVSQQTLNGCYLGNSGSVNTMLVGQTVQFHAYCTYSGAPTQDCSTTDIYGDAVSAWSSSAPAKMTMGALGGANPGLATGVATGSANAQASINGSPCINYWTMTVSTPTLTGVSLATTGGVTGLFVGSTNQLVATCTYATVGPTNCTTTDEYGNVAGTWVSTTPAKATVSTGGLVTGVAAGTTTFTAHAGSFTSAALPLTVLAVPTGVYTISITGPVTFSGKVSF